MIDDRIYRRWEELARELQFGQLQELRKQAEGWRTGLGALTGLLAALAVLKGRENLADLPQPARYWAMGLAASAFALLLVGSVLAVRASHGRPGEVILQEGSKLRAWTEQEVNRVSRALMWASVCCVAGIALIAGGVAVAWANTVPKQPNLVKVATSVATVCGELVAAGPSGVSLWATGPRGRELTSIPQSLITVVTPAPTC